MAEENKTADVAVGDRSGIFKIIGIAALVIVVVLLIILRPKKSVTKDEPVVGVNGNEDTALHVVSPVVEGGYEYAFTGIKWIFDTESPEVKGTNQTWLKMTFADFTRNGVAISFGNAYKLGVHPGTCKETDFIDTSSVEGVPFAYATCTDGKTKNDFAVLQREKNIVVVMNETLGGKETGWEDWYKINVTEIVR